MRAPKAFWMLALIAALAVPSALNMPDADAAGPTVLARTGWQVFRTPTYVSGISLSPFPHHGDIRYYDYAPSIPAGAASEWLNCGSTSICPDPNTINMHLISRLPGCWSWADFTFFQSFVSIPENATVTEFKVQMEGADDGARVSIINSAYPEGFVFSGSYIYLNGAQSTTDLTPYVVRGEVNRVVITQVDDCASQNNLHSAVITLNGSTVPVAPNADLSVTKTAPASAVLGIEFDYTINLQNAGPAQAPGIVVQDTLPANVKFVSAVTPCTPDGAATAGGGGTVTCSSVSVPVGSTVPLSIRVRAMAAGPAVNNVAITSLGANLIDPNTANNQATAMTQVVPPPCQPGTFSATGNEPCMPASPGNYVAVSGATAQTPCAPGTYQPLSGKTSCNLASPGSFVAGSGATAQTPCPAGTYQPFSGKTSCNQASVDYYVESAGAALQSPCPPGTTTNGLTGQTSCTPMAPRAAPPFSRLGSQLDGAKICVPLYMDQDLRTQYWWVRAAGGALRVDFAAGGVNAIETGSVTMTVYDPAGAVVATRIVVYSGTSTVPAAPVDVAAAIANTLYRVEVRAIPPASGQPARHYRLSATGASLIGTNSPLQPQAEGEDVRWRVNVASGETLDLTVAPGVEAPLTTGTMIIVDPTGLALPPIPLNGTGGTYASPSGIPAGQWTVVIRDADHHYILDKTSGADRGLYLGWNATGFGNVSGTVTRNGSPNSIPVSIEIGTGIMISNVTGTFSAPEKLAVGRYPVTIVGTSITATAMVTCDGTANITLDIPNMPPVAGGDATTTPEDTAVTVNVLANDSDVDGGTLSVASVTQGANGSVAIVGNQVTYTPAANFNGTDTFTYTVSDGQGGTATATVTVTVTPVNDPPVAVDDAVTTPEDTAVTVNVTGNDSDMDGDALSVTSVTQGANGGVAIVGNQVTYTPAANFNGTDTFEYTVSDGQGGSATATVTVTVTPVNDPPVAGDDSATTLEDTAATVSVLTNDSDVDGGTLSVASVTQGANGGVAINGGGTVTYTPAANFNGTDMFTYTVSDGQGGIATATVTVTVTPVNDPPVAGDDSATTLEDTAVTVSVLANDSDVDGDMLTVTSVTQGANGSVAIVGNQVTYTPGANFNGTDTFEYTVSDGQGGAATATVTVTVAPVNDAPVALDDSASTNAGAAVMIPVLANDTDIDGDTLTVSAVGAAGNGTTVLNADGTVTYTPAPGFSGDDTFDYTIIDGNGGEATATVTVHVNQFAGSGRMTGGGTYAAGSGKNAARQTWGFTLYCDGTKANLEFNDHVTGGRFHLEQVLTTACHDDPAVDQRPPSAPLDTLYMVGRGRWNNVQGATIEVTLVDAGEPGTADSVRLMVWAPNGSAVASVSGRLTGGNHQAHK